MNRLETFVVFISLWFLFGNINLIYAQKVDFFESDSSMYNIRGTWSTINYVEFYDSEDINTPIAIFQFNSETSYYLLDGFSLGGNAYIMYPHGFRFNDEEYEVRHTYGLGLAGMVRWEFVQLYSHNLFVESSFGFLFTSKGFPPEGTQFNFTQRYGFGMNISLGNKTLLVAGVRHMHISNGRGFVRENPQYNGNGVYVGVKFKN